QVYVKNHHLIINEVQKKQLDIELEAYNTLYDQMEIITSIGHTIMGNLDLESVLQVIYTEVKKLFCVDAFGIANYNAETEMISYDLFIERGERLHGGEMSVHREDLIGAYCVRSRKDIRIDDISVEYKRYVTRPVYPSNGYKKHAQSLICCPLMVQGEVRGFITVQSYKTSAYSKRESITLRALSAYVAISLENARLFHQLEENAKIDALTGCYNRGEIIRHGTERFTHAAERGESIAVAMIDFDDFKLVNDTYGHQGGDAVLALLRVAAQTALPSESIIGRYGGEEFLIVFSGGELQEIATAIQKLSLVYAELQNERGLTMRATFSVGVAAQRETDLHFQKLINRADVCLYEAKRQGKNRIVVDFNA
ncbi:MAG: diguanylate cyclase, partial [Bacilli bacterium]